MKMEFKKWEKCENKQETAKKMVQELRDLNGIQQKLIDALDFDKGVEGEWSENSDGNSVYFPTLFEAIFVFDIRFVYQENFTAGIDGEGRMIFGQGVLKKEEYLRSILEQEIRFGVRAGKIKTALKNTEPEEIVLF